MPSLNLVHLSARYRQVSKMYPKAFAKDTKKSCGRRMAHHSSFFFQRRKKSWEKPAITRKGDKTKAVIRTAVFWFFTDVDYLRIFPTPIHFYVLCLSYRRQGRLSSLVNNVTSHFVVAPAEVRLISRRSNALL
ncbi:hypothetical protein C12CBH8_00880 [Solibaculum mannosilyticum]|uniref:Uncharacterized protein n=1 Tax=Solibaculum mannosilyticum TaxID=2780922 RepID=A0A7I8D1Z1_9FIRM|nr:hypothetical protein C12CBH8_00880 [Solibaculum mannosilyticum]